jgi:hypothetical protein
VAHRSQRARLFGERPLGAVVGNFDEAAASRLQAGARDVEGRCAGTGLGPHDSLEEDRVVAAPVRHRPEIAHQLGVVRPDRILQHAERQRGAAAAAVYS